MSTGWLPPFCAAMVPARAASAFGAVPLRITAREAGLRADDRLVFHAAPRRPVARARVRE
ncbi:hypothetical protein BE17_42250 [Sorangium cellulosum]|uniref:Uncharacterized protein n=1 Tax=Sorangium cellulosum TaxID=56 RepID=A0A150SCR7_SORCE|nr:hypothetical protein BE17_42250 [Sorangium cellulosum]